ncbi:hypothetical protein DK28_0208770 [Peptococcaceae bacterium SCADC1_2_3]|nr:hypothetical protein DK28_0208770 [Peptococcaceae bacterium SCADC1_2_3]KFI35580.1 hypothetical protein HY00_03550 [Peptococcaceae bacterium SCADC1_2_3]
MIIVGEAELKLTRRVGALKLTPLQKFERSKHYQVKTPNKRNLQDFYNPFRQARANRKSQGKRNNYSAKF